MDQTLLVQDVGGVRTMRFNRAHVRNAIDYPTARALADAIAGLEDDSHLSVGVITGSEVCFSSGMDLKAFSRGERPYVPGFGASGIAEAEIAKPLIAAVEGFAIAGGFEVVLACDLLVASRDARFALPEVRRGLVASGGGLLRLPRRVPRNIAMELAMTGGELPAERAFELGLANRLVEPGNALRVAQQLALAITHNAPAAVVASKEIISRSVDWPITELFTRQRETAERIIQSDDAREGAAAFVGKRKPEWTGR